MCERSNICICFSYALVSAVSISHHAPDQRGLAQYISSSIRDPTNGSQSGHRRWQHRNTPAWQVAKSHARPFPSGTTKDQDRVRTPRGPPGPSPSVTTIAQGGLRSWISQRLGLWEQNPPCASLQACQSQSQTKSGIVSPRKAPRLSMSRSSAHPIANALLTLARAIHRS